MKGSKFSSFFIFLVLLFVSAAFGSDFFISEWQNFKYSQILGTQDDRGFEQAVVKRVIDGDTVELFDGRKVRYIGVDTPETNHPTKEVGCFGQEAKDFNRQLVEDQVIQLQKDVSETDRYGRLLRYVWLEDRLVNQVLLVEGYGFARSYPPDISRQDDLKSAEQFAQKENRGLWGRCYVDERYALNKVVDEADQAVLESADPEQVVKAGCVIKGNVSQAGKLYHLPECPSYSKVVVDESAGEQWFCSQDEATLAGWVKASNCP